MRSRLASRSLQDIRLISDVNDAAVLHQGHDPSEGISPLHMYRGHPSSYNGNNAAWASRQRARWPVDSKPYPRPLFALWFWSSSARIQKSD